MSSTRDIAKAAIDAAYGMLEQQGREADAPALARDLRHELSLRGGRIEATLTTPTGKAGPLAEKVQSLLEKKLGRSVELTERADPTLMGGAVLTYGDSRIDLSLRGALDDVRTHLESSR